MTPVSLQTNLSRSLLVVIAGAHTTGMSPPDWSDCAAAIGVRTSPRSIERSLSHLAEAGLIEGVMTDDGWAALRPTNRGLAQAGRHIQPPQPNGDHTAVLAPVSTRSTAERFTATVDEVSREVRAISQYTSITWLRTRRAMTPRLTAVRASVANTWNMFTSFP
jgi:hypothetical protein